MATPTRETEFVTRARQATIQFWDAYNELRVLQTEWNAQDYGSTLTIDPDGPHAGITPAQVGSVVFDTMNAVKTLMDGGHATNVTNLL